MKRLVTHYEPLPVDGHKWQQLDYYTKDPLDDLKVYFEFETIAFSLREINDRVEMRELCPLVVQQTIDYGQELWLDPLGDIYIAAECKPEGDPNRKFVQHQTEPFFA